ncbi:hypothetical protein T484DRAFT_1793726, partial [Baffinella frigidus]
MPGFRRGWALLGAAVGLALLASVLTITRPTALLTRGEVDKAVRGCKWWYCTESQEASKAAIDSAKEHPGYTIQE